MKLKCWDETSPLNQWLAGIPLKGAITLKLVFWGCLCFVCFISCIDAALSFICEKAFLNDYEVSQYDHGFRDVLKPFSRCIPMVQIADLCIILWPLHNEIKLTCPLGNQCHLLEIINSKFLPTEIATAMK